jgi:hypothetical protein
LNHREARRIIAGMPDVEPVLTSTVDVPNPAVPRPDIVPMQPAGVAFVGDAPPAGVAPDPPMVANPAQTDLAKILTLARAAHMAYRTAAPRLTNGQQVEDRTVALEALLRALELRETAEILDDDHSDPAWVDDVALGYSQRDLLIYYRQKKAQYLR